MPESIFDTDDDTLAFKEREWRVKRIDAYEWAISSASGDNVGVLRCATPLGSEGNSVFDLKLPDTQEAKETEGSDWLSMIEYAANEYLARQDPGSVGYVE